MVPTYAPGDLLWVHYGAAFAVGDVVLVDHGPQMDLKRVTRIEGNHIFVEGDNSAVSMDSRHYGAVPRTAIRATVVRRMPAFLAKVLTR